MENWTINCYQLISKRILIFFSLSPHFQHIFELQIKNQTLQNTFEVFIFYPSNIIIFPDTEQMNLKLPLRHLQIHPEKASHYLISHEIFTFESKQIVMFMHKYQLINLEIIPNQYK